MVFDRSSWACKLEVYVVKAVASWFMADVLEHFKGENGEFLSSAAGKSQKEINSILNLYRASFIAFPEEKVMDEAKAFSTKYLKDALHDISNPTLSREVMRSCTTI